jgi:hypothetical protein
LQASGRPAARRLRRPIGDARGRQPVERIRSRVPQGGDGGLQRPAGSVDVVDDDDNLVLNARGIDDELRLMLRGIGSRRIDGFSVRQVDQAVAPEGQVMDAIQMFLARRATLARRAGSTSPDYS